MRQLLLCLCMMLIGQSVIAQDDMAQNYDLLGVETEPAPRLSQDAEFAFVHVVTHVPVKRRLVLLYESIWFYDGMWMPCWRCSTTTIFLDPKNNDNKLSLGYSCPYGVWGNCAMYIAALDGTEITPLFEFQIQK